ncbi:type I-G CRISPR-associated helicase/endonuclease Cas3g [Streptomyces xanthophaeus]
MSPNTEERLQIEEFADFVQEVRGRRPFPWQIAYLHHVAETGIWPDLGIPTGLGKTSIIDIWVFLLAWQHASGVRRTVPLRLFFAVDRRLVVDQTHESSRTLQQALDTSIADTVTGRIADALRGLAGSTSPLECVRMRGGVDWASRWLRSPAQPAVITSTVDQFGSRLLFRGYHSSPRMRPIDAALCGMDALLALDEAHIALPLLATATDCAAYQATATDTEFAARALKVVSLSATASSGPGRPSHSITDADRAHPVAGRRLTAPRRLTLLDASSNAKDKAEAFAQAAEQALDTLLAVVERPLLGVVANTLRAARATQRLLSPREDVDLVLLTGRSRALDRERLLVSSLLTELLTGVAADRTKPLVVVATQTVEVGIDISFAGLITENASLAALVQRLGRLDRTGDLSCAPAVVIRVSTATDPSSIPVYGDAAEHTWNWLAGRTMPLTTTGLDPATLAAALPDGLLVSPLTLPGLLADTDTILLNVAPPRIPVVHRTLLDAWTRTSPTPVPDQAVAPFLHGLDTTPEDVQILWRADLQESDGAPDFHQWAARMQQLPPHPAETVAIPAAQLRRFLTCAPDADDTSDLESTPNTQDPVPAGKKQKPPSLSPALGYDQTTGAWMPITDPGGIRPGSTVVLPSHYGGHDTYGWSGTRTLPACDLGDYPPTATTPTRIHAPVLTLLAGGDEDLTDALTKTITRAVDLLHRAEHEEVTVVHNLLDALQDHLDQHPGGPYADLVHERLGHLRTVKQWTVEPTGRTERRGRVVLDPDEPDRLLLVPPHPPHGQREQGPGVGDESADASSLTRSVPLSRHSQAVADRTAAYATALALPTALIDTLRTAGHAHDCGKAHSRFQCMLCAGDQLLAESLDEPLAKSGMDPADHTARRRAARLAQWEPEMRHEALSALAVTVWLETAPDHARGDDELLTHLVAAHHGHARPLLPPVPDPFPQTVTCTMPDQQQVTVKSADMGADWSGPDRFQALNGRYGPWGLALLEATLRLADMACSEEGT